MNLRLARALAERVHGDGACSPSGAVHVESSKFLNVTLYFQISYSFMVSSQLEGPMTTVSDPTNYDSFLFLYVYAV